MADLSWQDAILTAGTVTFLLALVPTILGPTKPAKETAAMTGVVLLVFAATYLTLGLYFTAAVTAMTGMAWLVILAQAMGADRG